MTACDTRTPENARTSPIKPHYTGRTWVDDERDAAVSAPRPDFLAVYTEADALQFCRCIYALIDPRRPHVVMYVGQTITHPITRLSGHINEARRLQRRQGDSTARHDWICGLLDAGVTPTIAVLEAAASEDNLSFLEQKWIRFFRFRSEATMNGQMRDAELLGLTVNRKKASR